MDVKNQSSCSRRGMSCMLLHVYLLPLIGSSTRDCSRIISLNSSISLVLPPGLLRLSGDRIKLKSPARIQSSLSGMSKLESQSVNNCLSGPVHGPYMLTSFQQLADCAYLNSTPSAKDLENIRVPVNIKLLQATNKPPDAPHDGTNKYLSSLLGQKRLIKERSKEVRFVS